MSFYRMGVFQNIRNQIKILVFLGFIFSFGTGHACDLCSCATTSGSNAFGDLSMSNFIGFRYIHQRFESRDGIFANSPRSEEQFHTYQLWGKIPICESAYLSIVVPFQDLNRTFENRSERIDGLGDISIMGWYQFELFKKQNSEDVDFNSINPLANHSLHIGLGIKLPTGKFEEALTDKVNPGFQVGTGSLDVFPTMMYAVIRNDFGIVANVSYYFKSENKNDYKFGNQFSYATSAYFGLDTKLVTIKPFVGISGDIYNEIEQFGEVLQETDGSILNGSIGSEFSSGKFLLGAKFTLPIQQNLLNKTVESQNQLSLYLNYSL